MIVNTLNLIGSTSKTILHTDTLDRRLKAKLPVKSFQYDVCGEGCRLFGKNDVSTTHCDFVKKLKQNTVCNLSRFDPETSKPVRQMKMMSVGDVMARLLASDDIRNLMKYRHTYEHKEGVYRDYFDGEEYQNLLANTNLFDSEDDVALALFVDGFRADKANNGCKLAILHLLNLNLPPHIR